jgi:hypothetical protein
METTEQKILAALKEVVARLDKLETSVSALTAKKQPKGITFESIGGKKVGHPVPVKGPKEIDFSAIGGKCVQRACDHPMNKAKSEESTQQDVLAK